MLHIKCAYKSKINATARKNLEGRKQYSFLSVDYPQIKKMYNNMSYFYWKKFYAVKNCADGGGFFFCIF